MIIDTHCHIGKEYYENIDEIINNMNGLMITNGCDEKSNKEVLELVQKYSKVYGAIGIHPEEIDNIRESDFKFIEDNINSEKIVAVSEIGLDYNFNDSNKDKQKEVFKRQLDIAQKYNKPVVIHSRDSIQDTFDILKEYKLSGTIHCFNSSLEMANEFIKLGYKIGIGGVCTFKNAKKLQEIVTNISLENLLLETDSPYLSPEPFRGEKNEPSKVYYVAVKIAELKGIEVNEVLRIANDNALKIFDLKV